MTDYNIGNWLKKHGKRNIADVAREMESQEFKIAELARENAAKEKAYHLRGEEIVLLQAEVEELESEVERKRDACERWERTSGTKIDNQQQRIEELTREIASLKLKLKVGPESYEKQIEELEADRDAMDEQRVYNYELAQSLQAKVEELATPTPPDDVARLVEDWRNWSDGEPIEVEKIRCVPDMLERLADSQSGAILHAKYWQERCAEEKAKVEELESFDVVVTRELNRLLKLEIKALQTKVEELESLTVSVRGEDRDVSEFDVGDKTDGKHNCIKSDSWDNGRCQICGTPYHCAKL